MTNPHDTKTILEDAVNTGIQRFKVAIQAFHQADPGRKQKTTNDYVNLALKQSLQEAVAKALEGAQRQIRAQAAPVQAGLSDVVASPAPVAQAVSAAPDMRQPTVPRSIAIDAENRAGYGLRELADELLRLRATFIEIQSDVVKTHQGIYNHVIDRMVKIRVNLLQAALPQYQIQMPDLANRIVRDLDAAAANLMKSSYAIQPGSQMRFNNATTDLMVLLGRVRESLSDPKCQEASQEEASPAPSYRFA